MMLLHEVMIERVRQICRQDERLVGAVMYGSFALGGGDAFSDIEFVLFFRDESLPGIDQRAWVEQIAPVQLYFPDEWGHYTAIFDNLVRGEFHFEPASEMNKVDTWVGSVFFLSAESCIVLDRTGELARRVQPLLAKAGDRGANGHAQALLHNLANMTLFGTNVLARGEAARALEILHIVHRYVLSLARLAEGRTEHWATPSRGLEAELSPAAYARFVTCTAGLDAGALWQAYRAAWEWGRELAAALAGRYGVALPQALCAGISECLATQGRSLTCRSSSDR